MAVCSGGELRNSAKPRVTWIRVRKRREAPRAYGLISVHLRHVRLVDGASPDVLRSHVCAASELMLERKAPLHEVGCTELAARNGGHRNWRQTRVRVCARGGAREFSACEAGEKISIGVVGRVNRTVRNTGSQRGPAHRAEQAALKG